MRFSMMSELTGRPINVSTSMLMALSTVAREILLFAPSILASFSFMLSSYSRASRFCSRFFRISPSTPAGAAALEPPPPKAPPGLKAPRPPPQAPEDPP